MGGAKSRRSAWTTSPATYMSSMTPDGTRGPPCSGCYSFVRVLPNWIQKPLGVNKNGDDRATRKGVTITPTPGTADFDFHEEDIDDSCNAQLSRDGIKLDKNDPIQEHYKKGGFFGGITGAFGDKKTMYCHHVDMDS